MPMKLTTTTKGEKRKRKKIQKNLQNKSKHNNNKCFSWITAVRVLSLAGSHSPHHLSRIPSNTDPGPAVGAAQTLIWSYSCVFLSLMSTAIRASVYSFVGSQCPFMLCHRQSLPSWSCGFNLQLVQLVGRFWVFFFSHIAPGFQLWLYFHLYTWIVYWGLLLRLPWRTWVCPCEGQLWRCCSCLGCRDPSSTKCAETGTASTTGVMALSESFFEPLVAGNQKASLASLSP